MATNLFKLGLLITASQALLSINCGKGSIAGCGQNSAYSFLATAQWNPEKSTYRVGDTLYLTSVITKSLTDQINTSLVIDYSNSEGLYGDVGIGAPDSLARVNKPAKDSFDFFAVVGKVVPRPINTDFGINTLYQETAADYQLKVGLICKKKGLYAVSVDNLLSSGIKGKNCMKAAFGMTVTNADKHLVLWQNALGITLDADAVKKNYAFRVQ